MLTERAGKLAFSRQAAPREAGEPTGLTGGNSRGAGRVALAPGAFYRRRVPSALYNRDILRLAATIPHTGRLEAPQATVERRSPVCGSRIVIDVTLDSGGRVAALGQEVNACALGQAAASLLGAHALGATPDDLAAARDTLAAFLAGTREDPGHWPGLDVLAVAIPFAARHPSILLAFEAAAEAAALASTAAAPAKATAR